MNEILKAYLSVSVSASLLAMILILFRPLYQGRFSRHWQYYIWLVVIIRLLVPWNPVDGVVGHWFSQKQSEISQKVMLAEKSGQEEVTGNTEASWQEEETGKTEETGQEGAFRQAEETGQEGAFGQADVFRRAEATGQAEAAGQAGAMKQTETAEQTRATEQAEGSQKEDKKAHEKAQVQVELPGKVYSILQNIWIIWLAVAVLLLVRKVTIYRSFVKYLKAGCMAMDDIGRLEVLGKEMEKNHLRCRVGLFTNNLIASPLLIGFWNPNIILTTAELSDTDFYYTVLHELMHYKRRDMFYKWLVQLAICLHWFNPFVILMEHEVSRLCELSCDEAVVRDLDAEGIREYGNTLLHAMSLGGGYQNTLATMTLYESKELLKERLGAMMSGKKKTKIAVALSVLSALLMLGGAVATGAYMQPAAAEKAKDGLRLSDCKIIQKEGVFYVLCDGASKQDMPSGGVTEGCICITLVQKDQYCTIGPFDDMEELVRDVSVQVRSMRERNQLTEEEAQLLIEAAGKIQKDMLGVNINKQSVTLAKGQTITLKLTGTKGQAVWSSNHKKVATVGKKGKVTARKAGSAKITAKYGSQSYVCTVLVIDKEEGNTDGKKAVKSEEVTAEKYEAVGVTKKNGAYFYKGNRIRIFMDVRKDQSFVQFHYDGKGTVDVKLRRAGDSSIASVEYLTEAETEEILQDLELSDTKEILQDLDLPDTGNQAAQAYLAITRLQKNELSDEVLEAVSRCKAGTWYVINNHGSQYICYKGLPNDYAFEPEMNGREAKIKILDMKKPKSNDVLLVVRKNVPLIICYHDMEVEYKKITI